MGDVFVEQIVKKKRTATDVMKIILIILTAIIVASTFLIVNMLRLVFPFVFAVSIYFPYMFIRNLSTEYEYSVTNGDLDVDSIAGRRKRKRLLSIAARRFTILAPATEKYHDEFSSDSIRNVVEACISPNSEGLWFARYEDDQGLESAVFFNPSEKVLRALAKAAPRAIRDLPAGLLEEEN